MLRDQADSAVPLPSAAEYNSAIEDAEYLREYMESTRSFLAHVADAGLVAAPASKLKSLGARVGTARRLPLVPLRRVRHDLTSAYSAEVAIRNQILTALPADEFSRLRQHLVPVALRQGEVLVEPGQPFTHVYFPETAVISFVALLGDRTMVDVGATGYEGLVGLSPLLSANVSPSRVVVQMPGVARRIGVDRLKSLAGTMETLPQLILRFTHAYLTQLASVRACASLHLVLDRCASWLLTTQDRVHDDEFLLRYEFLAFTLGVRLGAATIAMRKLEDAGVITHVRDRLRIVDRGRLEDMACACCRTDRATSKQPEASRG